MASPRKAHMIVNGNALCGRSNTEHEDIASPENACKVCVKKIKETTRKCKICNRKIRGINHNLGDHHMKKDPSKPSSKF